MFTREETEEITSWLDSPTMAKTVALIEEKYTNAWKSASASEDREFCWRMIQCTRQVIADIQSISAAYRIEEFNRSRAKANDYNMPRPKVPANGADPIVA